MVSATRLIVTLYVHCLPYFTFFLFISFDQQSEYNVFHKLMSWQESSLWTNWRDEFPSSEEISCFTLRAYSYCHCCGFFNISQGKSRCRLL